MAGIPIALIILAAQLSLVLSWGPTFAAVPPVAPPSQQEKARLVDRLDQIRSKILAHEQALLASFDSEKRARADIKRLQELTRLRKEEAELGRSRMAELETTVRELESRRGVLKQRVAEARASLRRLLMTVRAAVEETPAGDRYSLALAEREKLEAPRRRVLANLIGRSIREIEIIKIDLADADRLEGRIREEREQLNYLFQDLDEKEGLLELNRQLQADLLRRKHQDRLAQLESYNKLKSAEAHVENLLKGFNARLELERVTETERVVARAMNDGAFEKLKGKLPFPVEGGKVLSAFGKAYDPKSRLYVFKKGIEISAGKKMPVRAISSGKVAYAGQLPGYGQVAIIDHGGHYYSLCAQLGLIERKAGELVKAGESIGITDESGSPVYFEIRARNVAVNPLQWVFN